MNEWKVYIADDEQAVFKILEGIIDELQECKWGKAHLEISAQGGKLVSIRRYVERTIHLQQK